MRGEGAFFVPVFDLRIVPAYFPNRDIAEGRRIGYSGRYALVAQLDRALPSEGKRKLFLLNISARKIE